MSSEKRPELLRISPERIDEALVRRACDALAQGELVAFPTETVYGLGCDAFNAAAVDRVFVAKGRPSTDPLIVHVDGAVMLERVIDGGLPPVARQLVEKFWPGPLTLVLPRAPALPAAVTSGLPTVAVRCPSHPVATAIVSGCGVPIAAPSANRFSHVSPTSAEHVVADLGDRCAIVVDSGRSERGLESTVVAFDGTDAIVVLRHGAVPVEELREHSSARIVDRETASHVGASPGHERRHYSPRSPTVAVSPGALRSVATVAIDALEGGRVAYAGYSDRRPQLPDSWRFESLGSLAALDGVAHDLYDSLRRMDAADVDVIVVELTGAGGLGRAIDDRLTRAASSLVVDSAEALRIAIDDTRTDVSAR